MIIQTGGTVSTGKNTTHLHQAGNIQVSVLLCCEHSPINLMIRVRFSRMHRKDAGTWGLPKKHLRNCMMNLKSWRFGVGFLRTSDFWDSKANLSPIWWVIPTRIWKTPGFLMGFLFIYWSPLIFGDFWNGKNIRMRMERLIQLKKEGFKRSWIQRWDMIDIKS